MPKVDSYAPGPVLLGRTGCRRVVVTDPQGSLFHLFVLDPDQTD